MLVFLIIFGYLVSWVLATRIAFVITEPEEDEDVRPECIAMGLVWPLVLAIIACYFVWVGIKLFCVGLGKFVFKETKEKAKARLSRVERRTYLESLVVMADTMPGAIPACDREAVKEMMREAQYTASRTGRLAESRKLGKLVSNIELFEQLERAGQTDGSLELTSF